MKHLEVVAAVIINNENKILCMQRGASKYAYISNKYEFPGGKVEKHESIENALKREINEELGIDIDINNKLIVVDHDYPDFAITMHVFICKALNNNISLNSHIDYLWLNVNELKELDWAEADLPIVERLANEPS